MISVNQIGDALSYIMRDEVVFDDLQKDFPAILADLVTFKNNPNCSCRSKVIKFFTEQITKDPFIMNKYIHDLDGLKTHLNTIQSQRQQNNYAGKVFEIDKTPEAWETFVSKTLNGKIFRNFSVAEREQTVVIYLL